MPLLADRVLESTSTTGTGTFALGGALTGYRAFNSAFSNGDIVYYTADNGQGEWEVGYGTIGTGTLSRDVVLESSNANALVVFSAGVKRLFCTAPASAITNASLLGTGVATFLTTPSSANLAAAVTGETGSGALVFATSPTLVTPALGTPSSGTLTSCTGLPLSTGVTGTLPVANGGTGVTTSTGSGSNVLSTSPTLVTPALGTPSSGTLTSCTGLPLSTGVTGTLPVANGGTGTTSLTANNVLLGNGTSALQVVAPGSSGNVLTSNGTTWASAAPSASLTGQTNAGSPYETSLGTSAGGNNTGSYNTFLGFNTGQANTTGGYNLGAGSNALFSNTTGQQNTAVGDEALYSNNGSNNTAVGLGAGYGITSGTDNTLLGFSAGYGGTTLTTGANNTIIGSSALPSSSSVSNTITLGNSSIATLRCQVTTITALSDARDKTDIAELDAGLDFINALAPVSFTWNMRDGGKVDEPDTGFIAQELVKAQEDTGHYIPGLVYDDNPERLEAGYGKLIPVLVKAIQELSAEVSILKSQLNGPNND